MAARPARAWRGSEAVRADLMRIMGLWRLRLGGLALGAAIAVATGLLGLALMLLAGAGLSQVALGTGAAAAGALLWLRPIVLLRPAMRYAERITAHEATFRALADTRLWFFRRLAERLPAGLGLRRAGDLLGRLVADVEALDRLYLGTIVPAVVAGAIIVAVALLLGAASPALAAIVVLPMAAALLLPVLLAPGAVRAAARVAEAQGALRAAAVDPLAGIEDTLAANAEPLATARLDEAGGGLATAEHALAAHGAWGGAAGLLLGQAALLGALAWGFASGPFATPIAVLGVFAAVAAADTLGLLPRAGAALAAARAAAARLFEAADAPLPVPEPTAPAAPPKGHAIAFRGVVQGWAPDRPPVYEGLDLEIPEGLRVAILGPSGAGKSTLAAMLLKLTAPREGTITLGGVDIATLRAEDVRARIACLTQDARLFDDSIAMNLRLANPEATEEELWQALERARIAELVRALPEGLGTRCGEAGVRFSGGQARRLALARALLSPAPVLILDEPAAGLDAETERAFLETLDEATAGRTVILILHRLTGVERPQRILRIAGGRAIPAAG